MTAQAIVARIQQQLASQGVTWREGGRDTFKAGDPQTAITGIATTVMATLPVLREAAAAGRNLIVTCEPTFYNGNDDSGTRANDPVYLAKKAFIDEHHLVSGLITQDERTHFPVSLLMTISLITISTDYSPSLGLARRLHSHSNPAAVQAFYNVK